MKNLDVNIEKFKKGIKYTIVPIALSSLILLNGCVLMPNGENAKYKTNDTDTAYNIAVPDETNDISFFDSNKAMISIKEGAIDRTYIDFNAENLNEFKLYLNNINVEYDYEDLYKLNDALNEYEKLNLTKKHLTKLNEITADSIYRIVKCNNKQYEKSALYENPDSKELNDISKLIADTVNNFLKENSMISEDRIKCVLSDLKIFIQNSTTSNAYVTNDNILVISHNMLKIAKILGTSEEDVIIHEINHLLQKGCNCDLELNSNLKRNFGFSYEFKEIENNSLDLAWIYEASAEKNMTNYTGHEPLVYKSKIGYLESLSLVNILNDNYNVNDTEKLSFYKTLDDLYRYFNVSTDSDKMEILKLMYSINVIQEAPDDFYKLYEENTGIKVDESVIDDVNYTIKSSICETLTKLFYRNLAINIVNKDVTLQDVFYLISLFENDINNHILYDSSKLYNYNEKFINTYIDIQDNFFYQLSKIMICSQEDIEMLFDNYSAKIKTNQNDIVDNYSLDFISKEKIEYLKERQEFLSDIATVNIKEADCKLSKISQKCIN